MPYTIKSEKRIAYAPLGVKDGAFMVKGPDGEHFFTNRKEAELYLLSLNRRALGGYALESGSGMKPRASRELIAKAVAKELPVQDSGISNLEVEHTIANHKADAQARALTPTATHILGLNLTSPVQWLRTGADVIYGGQSFVDALGNQYAYGNNGLVTDKFAAEHPNWTFAINTIGDMAGYGAMGKILNGGVGFANGGVRFGNSVVRPVRGLTSGAGFEVVPYSERFAEEAAARGAALDAARIAQQRAAGLESRVAEVTSRAEQAEARLAELERQAERTAANSTPATTPVAESTLTTVQQISRPTPITREIKGKLGTTTEKGYRFTDKHGEPYELFGKEAEREYARLMKLTTETETATAAKPYEFTFRPLGGYRKPTATWGNWGGNLLNVVRDQGYLAGTGLVLDAAYNTLEEDGDPGYKWQFPITKITTLPARMLGVPSLFYEGGHSDAYKRAHGIVTDSNNNNNNSTTIDTDSATVAPNNGGSNYMTLEEINAMLSGNSNIATGIDTLINK